jgi:hypothetical protein
VRKFGILVCALVLVPAAVAVAGSPPAPYLVTGGGQVLTSSDPSSEQGPGDTIAFVAGLDESNTVFGSLQVVNTSEADERQRPEIIFNGRVECVEPMGENMARFGGTGRAPDGSMQPFTVDVQDSGDENRGTDMIEFRFTDRPCEDGSGTVLNGTTLARGNLKVDTANSGGGQ